MRQRRVHELEHALDAGEVAKPHGAQVPASRRPAGSFGAREVGDTAFDNSTWPPCAIAMMRARAVDGAAENSRCRAPRRGRACSPHRTCQRESGGAADQPLDRPARAATPSAASSNTAWMPSPVDLTKRPRCTTTASRATASWRARAFPHPNGIRLPEPGAPLDVGEEDGGDASACVHATCPSEGRPYCKRTAAARASRCSLRTGCRRDQ
jgi:hypothetical protein